MAKKAEVIEEETVPATEPVTEKPKKAAESIMQVERKVTIKLPKQKGKGDVFVSVNERTYLVQRGVPVSVPESVAEVIATSERYEEEAEDYDEQMRK